jgi:hypothetical protein
MRPITVSVGPLASASANSIALSQAAPAGQQLALNGTLAIGASATNIAASQSVVGAAAVVLNGSTVSGGVAYAPNVTSSEVVITSAGNDTGINFTIKGVAQDGVTSIVETIKGSNTSVTSSLNNYYKILSITTSGSTASTITVGFTSDYAKLDTLRQITITSAGNDSGITFLIRGYDQAGNPITETLAGANAGAATSVLSYAAVYDIIPSGATASTVTVGTAATAYSPWVRFDDFGPSTVAIQATASGTVNYTIQTSLDDPNDSTNPVSATSMTWVSSSDTNVVSATATQQSNFLFAPKYARVFLNSGTGSVKTTFIQASAVPL